MKFELANSRLIRRLVLLAHAFAALMVVVTAFPLSVKSVLLGLLIVGALYSLRRSQEPLHVEITKDCICLVGSDAARQIEYRLLPSSFVAAYLVVLHLKSASGLQ